MTEATTNRTNRAVLLFRQAGKPKAASEAETAPVPVVQVVRLSRLELDVLLWLSKGKRYADISEIMTMSVDSIYAHTHRIMNKLGAGTSAGAVGIALRKGIID